LRLTAKPQTRQAESEGEKPNRATAKQKPSLSSAQNPTQTNRQNPGKRPNHRCRTTHPQQHPSAQTTTQQHAKQRQKDSANNPQNSEMMLNPTRSKTKQRQPTTWKPPTAYKPDKQKANTPEFRPPNVTVRGCPRDCPQRRRLPVKKTNFASRNGGQSL